MTPSRPRRLLVAAVTGLAVPLGEVALKCRGEPRPGQATAEACTWARAWLPLTGPGYFVLVGGAVYGLLGLATRRRDEPDRGPE